MISIHVHFEAQTDIPCWVMTSFIKWCPDICFKKKIKKEITERTDSLLHSSYDQTCREIWQIFTENLKFYTAQIEDEFNVSEVGKVSTEDQHTLQLSRMQPPPPIHPPGDGYKVTNTIHTTPLYQKYVHSLICLGDRGNATYDLHLLKKKGGGATWLSTTFANRVQKKWEILTFNLVAQNDNAMLSQKKNMFTLCFLTQDK